MATMPDYVLPQLVGPLEWRIAMSNRLVSLSFAAAAAVITGVLAGCGGAGPEEAGLTRLRGDDEPSAAAASLGGLEFIPGQVLVKMAPGATLEDRRKALASVSGRQLEQLKAPGLTRAAAGGEILVVETSMDPRDASAVLKGRSEVAIAEPNYIYQHQATSNDPYYTSGNLWGMYGDASSPVNQFGSQAAEAWAAGRTGSATIHVGIIDEGVMLNHADLSGQIWINPYDPADGVDNDGNGYVDDVNGWDFNDNNASVFDGGGDDHGTHVAGTIGAKGGNGAGVAGVVWNTKMIVCKFLGSRGGSTSNAIKALDYLTDLKLRHGIDIVASNNSWGGGGFSQLLKDAIDRHGAANILAIVAAGNSGVNIDSSPSYPASYTSANIISVASITKTGARSSFSNYGATSVDIGAPGSAIFSTIPSKSGTGSNYSSYNGTSMATPHVTGAAALLAASSSARGTALKDAILAAGTATASMNGTTSTGKRLNAGGF